MTERAAAPDIADRRIAQVEELDAIPSTDTDGAAIAKSSSSVPGRQQAIVIVVAATTLVGLRVWLMTFATLPRIMADEVGSWAIARFLITGSPEIYMLTQPAYPVGIGALLVPVAWFGDPEQRYVGFQIMAFGLYALGAWWCSGAIATATGLARRLRVGLTVAAMAYPATYLTSAFSWAEFAVPAYWALLVVVAFQYDWTGWSYIVRAALIVGCAPLVHGRFLAIPIIWICANLVTLALTRVAEGNRRERMWRTAGIAIAGVTLAASMAVNDFVITRVWGAPRSASSSWSSQLDEARFYKTFAVMLLGQLWYALVATGGLALLGAITLARRALTPQNRRPAILLIAFMASNLAASLLHLAGAISGRSFAWTRPDHLFYGRYVDGLTWVLFVLGFATLLSRRLDSRLTRWPIVVAPPVIALVGFALWRVVLWIDDRTELLDFFGPTVPGVWLLPGRGSGYDLVGWTVIGVAAAGAVGLAAAARRPTAVLATVLVLCLAGSTAATLKVKSVHERWRYDAAIAVPEPTSSRDDLVIASDVVNRTGYSLMVFAQQFHVTARGWDIVISDQDSSQLVAAPPSEAGLMVLAVETPMIDSAIVGYAGPTAIVSVP